MLCNDAAVAIVVTYTAVRIERVQSAHEANREKSAVQRLWQLQMYIKK